MRALVDHAFGRHLLLKAVGEERCSVTPSFRCDEQRHCLALVKHRLEYPHQAAAAPEEPSALADELRNSAMKRFGIPLAQAKKAVNRPSVAVGPARHLEARRRSGNAEKVFVGDQRGVADSSAPLLTRIPTAIN